MWLFILRDFFLLLIAEWMEFRSCKYNARKKKWISNNLNAFHFFSSIDEMDFNIKLLIYILLRLHSFEFFFIHSNNSIMKKKSMLAPEGLSGAYNNQLMEFFGTLLTNVALILNCDDWLDSNMMRCTHWHSAIKLMLITQYCDIFNSIKIQLEDEQTTMTTDWMSTASQNLKRGLNVKP